MLGELIERPIQQVDRELCRGPEAAPLDENGFVVQDLRWLHDLAMCGEHRGIGEPTLHQHQAHSPVIDVRKRRACQFDHVDLDTLAREVVHQRGDQADWVVTSEQGTIKEIDAEHAERFLLTADGRFEEVGVNDDVRWIFACRALESDAKPAAALPGMPVARRGDRVGEDEKSRRVTTLDTQTLQQFTKLEVEHGFQALAADVPLRGSVERVADRHVVSRDRLGHRSGRASDGKEPSSHLLPAADFRERAVRRGIEIDG